MNEFEPVFQAASNQVQFTVVVVIGKVAPEFLLQVTVTAPSTRSVPVTVKVTTAPDGPVASTLVILAGTVITGGVVSIMKEAPVELPARSVTTKTYIHSEIGVSLEYGAPFSVAQER